jgi:hypothetical protein
VTTGAVAAGPARIWEGHAMTHRILWMPAGPARPPLADARDVSTVTSSRSGWSAPGRDRSGTWLRNAGAGLCVLAAAAAAVSFTASGDVGYCNCLNAPQVGVGRVSAAG